VPTTPEEWLPILAKRLDDRADRIQRLRSYCNGHAPLPEMGKNLRETWEAFQKKARINYGGLAVWALKRRIRPRTVRIGDLQPDDELLVAARRIWRDNRLHRQFGDAIRDRLEVSVGYLVVGRDAAQRAVVTREKPEFFVAVTDPVRSWKTIAAIKVWRDPIANLDYAWVWVEGQRQKFQRPSKVDSVWQKRAYSETWELSGDPEAYDGLPPVVVLERPDHQALLESHLDAIDGINLGKLQRLVITAMQAFKQRAIKSSESGELPDKDDEGNDIDYRKVFEHAPGALWDLPAGVDIWESPGVDITPLLNGEKADRRDFAAVTSTPLSVFMPEGENQSAEGAANAKEGHVSLAEEEIDDLGPGLAVALVYALKVEGQDLADQTVEIDFAPPALVSLSERYAAAAQAKAAGLSRKTILRDVLGMTPEEIKLEEANFADEQLAAFALTGAIPGQPGAGGQPAA
jgi:hypothetical protein